MNGVTPSFWPGIITVGVGALAGLLGALRLRRGAVDVGMDKAVAIADCEERASHAIAQLRDLQDQRHRLTQEAFASQTHLYEQQAASALRERDTLTRQTRQAEPKAVAPRVVIQSPVVAYFAKRPQLRGALWGALLVGVVAALLHFVSMDQTPRGDGMSVTGNAQGDAPAAQGAGQGVQDAETQALIDRLYAKPDDIEALLRLSHKLLRAMSLKEAAFLNDRVLQLDPQNPEALVHQAVLTSSQPEGMSAAIEQLTDLAHKHPTMAEVWLFRGMLGMRSGNQELMRESFTKFLEVAPDGEQKERIRAMLNNPG